VVVLSKIIVDEVASGGGQKRLGGGGVQAAVGMRCAGLARCALVAPVGVDFDRAMLLGLERRGVDTSRVCTLPDVPTTPGERLWYDKDEQQRFEPVGWEHWAALCAWAPQLPLGLDAVHVLVEGGGDGEVGAVLNAIASAAPADQPTDRGILYHAGAVPLSEPDEPLRPEAPLRLRRPLVSVEPVTFEVTCASVAGLKRLTAVADVVSPDLLTAARIAALEETFSGGGSRSSLLYGASSPAALSAGAEAAARAAAVLARADGATLQQIVRRCAVALALPAASTLAVRDGARGSYVLAPDGVLTRVPAVLLSPGDVQDPTGAGNAYAGTMCAQLAMGCPTLQAAAVASAVGAAFCKCPGWAPDDVEAAAAWVAAKAAELRLRPVE
jgi:sugar/nucleoside kinase (ribokinase family)